MSRTIEHLYALFDLGLEKKIKEMGIDGTGLYLLGHESKPFRFYTDFWNGLKRNWKQWKLRTGENGNGNLRDGLTIIVNIDRLRDTTISPSQNEGRFGSDISGTKENLNFRNNDDGVRSTAITTVATILQNKGMPNSTKISNVDNDVTISPEGDTNSSFPESLHSSLTSDSGTSELRDPKVVSNELNTELGIPSTGRSIKQEEIETITHRSGLLEKPDEQVMNDAASKIKFLPPLVPLAEDYFPHIDPPLSAIKLEQPFSFVVFPSVPSPVLSSTVTPVVANVDSPASSPEAELEVATVLTKNAEYIDFLSHLPTVSNALDRTKGFVNVLQATAKTLPETKESEFSFLIPTLPDEFKPSRTVEKTIEVGAEILSNTVRNTAIFRSFPDPLEPTRALEKGVEAGVKIISEATKDQNMFLNGSPNTLGQLRKLGNIVLTKTSLSESTSDVPEDGTKLDTKELDQKLSNKTLLTSALTPQILLEVPQSFDMATESEGVVLPTNFEYMPTLQTDGKFADTAVTTSCPQVSGDNNAPPSEGSLFKNSTEIEIDEACSAHNKIDYVNNTYKREDKESIDIDSNENFMADRNNDSHNNKKHEAISVQPDLLSLVAPSSIWNPKEAGTESAEIVSAHKQPIIVSLNLLNLVIVPAESSKIPKIDPKVSSPESSPPFEIPLEPLNSLQKTIESFKSTISTGGISSRIEISQMLLNPFEANIAMAEPVKTPKSGEETLPSTVPNTDLSGAAPTVRIHPLEKNIIKTGTAKADEEGTEAVPIAVPIISSSGTPLTFEIPPSLNSLKGATEIAESSVAEQLLSTVSVIPPLIETAELSSNPFEAEEVVTEPAEVIESHYKTSSKAPVILPNETASPVLLNPQEIDIPTTESAERTEAPIHTTNEMPSPIETPQQSLNQFEAGIATDDPANALESAGETSSLTVSHLSPDEIASTTKILHPSPTAKPIVLDWNIDDQISTASVMLPNGSASSLEIPAMSLHPQESDLAISDLANTDDKVIKELSPTVPATSPTGILQPVVPQLLLNTFGADGAIANPTNDLGSGDKTLASTVPGIQAKERALPGGLPFKSLNPLEEMALGSVDGVLSSSASVIPPNRAAPTDAKPSLILNTFGGGVDTPEPVKPIEAGVESLSSTIPSNVILQPTEAPQLSLNETRAGIAMSDAVTPSGSATETLDIVPNGTASLIGIAPMLLVPPESGLATAGLAKASGKVTNAVLDDPTKEVGSDKTLSSTTPNSQSKETASSVEIPFELLNPLEAGVAMADPAKALAHTVQVIPPNGAAQPDEIPALMQNEFEGGIGTANSANAYQASAEPLSSTALPIDIPPTQLPLNSCNATTDSVNPSESGSETLSSTVSYISPNETTSPIEMPPISSTANSIESYVETTSSATLFASPNRTASLVEVLPMPLDTHGSNSVTVESAKAPEEDTKKLLSTVSATSPGEIPPSTEVPHLLQNSDEMIADLTKDLASADKMLLLKVPNIQQKETASPLGLPFVLPNSLEGGVLMADSTKALKSFGKALPFKVPIIQPNGKALTDEVPLFMQNQLEKGVGTAESAKAFQAVAKALLLTPSQNNIPSPFEVPRLRLDLFDAGITMTASTTPFESASESLFATVSDIPPSKTVSPVEVRPVTPIANATGSGDKSSTALAISSSDKAVMSLLSQESGLATAASAEAPEKDTQKLSPTVSSSSAGEIPPPIEVPQLSLNTAETAIADPSNYLESGDRTRSSRVSSIQPEETALPVEVPFVSLNPLEAVMVDRAKALESALPPSMLNPFGGDLGTSESTNAVQNGNKASSIEIPKQSSNLLKADIPMSNPRTALESASEALSSTEPIVLWNGIASQAELLPASLNPIDEGLETTESSKIAEKYAKQLSTTGPVTSPIETLAESAKASGTNIKQLSGAVDISLPQLSLNPLEAGTAKVDPEKLFESEGEGEASTVPGIPPNGTTSPVRASPLLLNSLVEGVTTPEPMKLVDTDSKEPSNAISITSSRGIPLPTGIRQLSQNSFDVDVAMTITPKTLESDDKALSATLPTTAPNGTNFVSSNPLKERGVIAGSAEAATIIGTPQFSVNLFEVSVATADPAKALESDREALTSPVPIQPPIGVVPPIGLPNILQTEALNLTGVGPSKVSLVDGKVPLPMPPDYLEINTAVEANTDLLKGKFISISPSASQQSSVVSPFSLSNLDTEVAKSSSASVSKANVTELQRNVEAASQLSVQIPATADVIDLPILTPSLPESSTSARVSTVASKVHADVTKELSSKSPFIPSSMPNTPWLTTPVPLQIRSTSVQAATLKQNSAGIKLSEVSEVAEAGPKLTRSTFSKELHIPEQPNEEVIEIESGDLASDWNRDMLGKTPFGSAASSIVEMDFGRKDTRPLYKIFNIMRDMSGKKMKVAKGSTSIQ
nr:unnamed protein product [Callosobruchus chinensis]